MPGKRLNGPKLVLAPGTFPVGLELGSVQACPLGDERLRPPRQETCDHVAVQVDGRRLPTVACVKVRSGVMCLVPVHVDRDAVEERPARRACLRARPHSLDLAEDAGETALWTTLAASWMTEQRRRAVLKDAAAAKLKL